jgi:hypothetical protein
MLNTQLAESAADPNEDPNCAIQIMMISDIYCQFLIVEVYIDDFFSV